MSLVSRTPLPKRFFWLAGTIIALASSLLVFLCVERINDLKNLERDLISIREYDARQDAKKLETELANLAANPSMLEALASLSSGYDAYIPDHLRDMYVALNPYLGDDLSLLEDPRDGSLYSQAHARHHTWLRNVARRSGYNDLMLVRADGHIIYSVRKGRAFATRLQKAEDESGFRELSRTVQAVNSDAAAPTSGISKSHVSLSGEEVFFAAAPLRVNSGQVAATLVVEHPVAIPGPTRQVTEQVEKARAKAWAEGAASLALFGIPSLFLLGMCAGFPLLSSVHARGQLQLPLVPLEETARENADSTRPGSHRSGTRQVLHSHEGSDSDQAPQTAEHG